MPLVNDDASPLRLDRATAPPFRLPLPSESLMRRACASSHRQPWRMRIKDLPCSFRRFQVLSAAGCEAQPHSTAQESDFSTMCTCFDGRLQHHNLVRMAKACLHAKLPADDVGGGVMWCR
jgi:hypothetical protein